jgi:hypothetical protein
LDGEFFNRIVYEAIVGRFRGGQTARFAQAANDLQADSVDGALSRFGLKRAGSSDDGVELVESGVEILERRPADYRHRQGLPVV